MVRTNGRDSRDPDYDDYGYSDFLTDYIPSDQQLTTWMGRIARRRNRSRMGRGRPMTNADITEEDLNDTLNEMYELQKEIKQLNAAIARMFEKGLITDDMIGEALDEKTDADDLDSLGVIFCSWGGDQRLKDKATEQFRLILLTIRSYR